MSLLFRTIQSRYPSVHISLSAAIQRITNREQKARHSEWFTKISGNLAAHTHAVPTTKGLRVWLTLCIGWHTAEYIYSHIHFSVSEMVLDFRKFTNSLAARLNGWLT